MAEPLNPDFWLNFQLEKVPIPVTGTDEYRWARRPMADAGSFKEGRVEKWGTIKRDASNPAGGDYRVTKWTADLADGDGAIRALLATKPTRHWLGREGAFQMLSETGRAAELTPRTLFRGLLTDIQTVPGRRVRLEFSDALGFNFVKTNLEKKIPQAKLRRLEHPNLPDKNDGRVYPIYWGEHSDFGVKDANGNDADVGRIPLLDTGDYVLTESGQIDEDAQPIYLNAPTGLGYVVNGTPGTTLEEYVITAVSAHGETTASEVISVPNAPDVLDLTNYIALTWGAQTGAAEYRVYKRTYGAFKLIARLNNNETWVTPETTWADTGSAEFGTRAITPPATNTAQIDQVVDGESAFGWGRLLVCIGEMHSYHDVYGSDLADGGQPKRVRLPDSAYGTEVLVPDRAGWPHAARTVTINGIEMSVIYARGERLKHHRDGTVTMTLNGCGAFGPNGKVYDEAFPTLQWLLNEHVFKNDGEGYRAGAYGPLVEYSNGVPIVKPSAFAAAQAKTVGYIGGRGYLTTGGITEPITVREFLHRYMVTFDFIMADDHHGQVYPILIDSSDVDSTVGRAYRSTVNIRRVKDIRRRHADIETKVVWHYDYDSAAGEFAITNQQYEDGAMSEAHKEVKSKEPRHCYYSRDKASMEDSNMRHVRRFKLEPIEIDIEVDFTGLEDENGDQVRIDTYELDDSGVLKPFLVIGHEVDPNVEAEKVILTCFDLSRYETVSMAEGTGSEITVSIGTPTLVPGTSGVAATSALVSVSATTATI